MLPGRAARNVVRLVLWSRIKWRIRAGRPSMVVNTACNLCGGRGCGSWKRGGSSRPSRTASCRSMMQVGETSSKLTSMTCTKFSVFGTRAKSCNGRLVNWYFASWSVTLRVSSGILSLQPMIAACAWVIAMMGVSRASQSSSCRMDGNREPWELEPQLAFSTGVPLITWSSCTSWIKQVHVLCILTIAGVMHVEFGAVSCHRIVM